MMEDRKILFADEGDGVDKTLELSVAPYGDGKADELVLQDGEMLTILSEGRWKLIIWPKKDDDDNMFELYLDKPGEIDFQSPYRCVLSVHSILKDKAECWERSKYYLPFIPQVGMHLTNIGCVGRGGSEPAGGWEIKRVEWNGSHFEVELGELCHVEFDKNWEHLCDV